MGQFPSTTTNTFWRAAESRSLSGSEATDDDMPPMVDTNTPQKEDEQPPVKPATVSVLESRPPEASDKPQNEFKFPELPNISPFKFEYPTTPDEFRYLLHTSASYRAIASAHIRPYSGQSQNLSDCPRLPTIIKEHAVAYRNVCYGCQNNIPHHCYYTMFATKSSATNTTPSRSLSSMSAISPQSPHPQFTIPGSTTTASSSSPTVVVQTSSQTTSPTSITTSTSLGTTVPQKVFTPSKPECDETESPNMNSLDPIPPKTEIQKLPTSRTSTAVSTPVSTTSLSSFMPERLKPEAYTFAINTLERKVEGFAFCLQFVEDKCLGSVPVTQASLMKHLYDIQVTCYDMLEMATTFNKNWPSPIAVKDSRLIDRKERTVASMLETKKKYQDVKAGLVTKYKLKELEIDEKNIAGPCRSTPTVDLIQASEEKCLGSSSEPDENAKSSSELPKPPPFVRPAEIPGQWSPRPNKRSNLATSAENFQASLNLGHVIEGDQRPSQGQPIHLRRLHPLPAKKEKPPGVPPLPLPSTMIEIPAAVATSSLNQQQEREKQEQTFLRPLQSRPVFPMPPRKEKPAGIPPLPLPQANIKFPKAFNESSNSVSAPSTPVDKSEQSSTAGSNALQLKEQEKLQANLQDKVKNDLAILLKAENLREILAKDADKLGPQDRFWLRVAEKSTKGEAVTGSPGQQTTDDTPGSNDAVSVPITETPTDLSKPRLISNSSIIGDGTNETSKKKKNKKKKKKKGIANTTAELEKVKEEETKQLHTSGTSHSPIVAPGLNATVPNTGSIKSDIKVATTATLDSSIDQIDAIHDKHLKDPFLHNRSLSANMDTAAAATAGPVYIDTSTSVEEEKLERDITMPIALRAKERLLFEVEATEQAATPMPSLPLRKKVVNRAGNSAKVIATTSAENDQIQAQVASLTTSNFESNEPILKNSSATRGKSKVEPARTIRSGIQSSGSTEMLIQQKLTLLPDSADNSATCAETGKAGSHKTVPIIPQPRPPMTKRQLEPASDCSSAKSLPTVGRKARLDNPKNAQKKKFESTLTSGSTSRANGEQPVADDEQMEQIWKQVWKSWVELYGASNFTSLLSSGESLKYVARAINITAIRMGLDPKFVARSINLRDHTIYDDVKNLADKAEVFVDVVRKWLYDENKYMSPQGYMADVQLKISEFGAKGGKYAERKGHLRNLISTELVDFVSKRLGLIWDTQKTELSESDFILRKEVERQAKSILERRTDELLIDSAKKHWTVEEELPTKKDIKDILKPLGDVGKDKVDTDSESTSSPSDNGEYYYNENDEQSFFYDPKYDWAPNFKNGYFWDLDTIFSKKDPFGLTPVNPYAEPAFLKAMETVRWGYMKEVREEEFLYQIVTMEEAIYIRDTRITPPYFEGSTNPPAEDDRDYVRHFTDESMRLYIPAPWYKANNIELEANKLRGRKHPLQQSERRKGIKRRGISKRTEVYAISQRE